MVTGIVCGLDGSDLESLYSAVALGLMYPLIRGGLNMAQLDVRAREPMRVPACCPSGKRVLRSALGCESAELEVTACSLRVL